MTEGSDPLHLADDSVALADGQFHSSEQWLSVTRRGRYPDLVPQIVECFDSPRAGDLMLFAAPGFGFHETNRAGHGGLTREEMVVPMVFAGPGVPAGGHLPYARSVDVLPTLLEHLGRLDALNTLNPIDGVSRLKQLQRLPTSQP